MYWAPILYKYDGLPCVSPDELRPPAPQPEEDEPVQDVAEAVRIKEVLGHPTIISEIYKLEW